MNSEDLAVNCLKRHPDTLPPQFIRQLLSPGYDDDSEDDDGVPLGIRGFEDSDSGEEDGDIKLSLWPHHYNDPQPKPHPLDDSGVYCREWGSPITIKKLGSKRALWTAPLIPQNLFGHSIEHIITDLEADPTVFIDIIRASEVDQAALTRNSSKSDSPRSSEEPLRGSSISILAESPSETLVESPSAESPHPATPCTPSNFGVPISKSPIPCSTTLTYPLPASLPHILSNCSRVIPSKEEESRQEISFGAEESRSSGSGAITSNTAKKCLSLPIQKTPCLKKSKPFPCPAKWCGLSFTRASDAERHFKNAAIHQGTGNSDSSTRCQNCGEKLSRLDARRRHEFKNACGKRRPVRKFPGPHL